MRQRLLLPVLVLACADARNTGTGGSSEATASGSTGGPSTSDTTDESAGPEGTTAADGSSTGGTTTPARERLWVGTGEYSATQDWHAILRFEDALELDAAVQGPATPDGTTNLGTTFDQDGVPIVFVHTIFVDESIDELYAGALFTTTGAQTCMMMQGECGGIAVFAGASALDGPQLASRHVFGPATTLDQPHGVWVDRARDILYAANTFAGTVLAWDGASSVDGDAAPDRTITTAMLGAPVHVYVDDASDRAFVAAMPPFGPGEFIPPHVEIFEAFSTLDGEVEPSYRIAGPSTRLALGNPTTHNTWWLAEHELLVVGHHTNEVLFFDLAALTWDAGGPTQELDLVPRVLEINESDTDADDWSAYGLFYVEDGQRLYVAAGYTPAGPAPGSDQHAVKVYEAVASPAFEGRVDPVREIRWDNVDQYFPPQPLWVQRH
jgi:hypothetical protein